MLVLLIGFNLIVVLRVRDVLTTSIILLSEALMEWIVSILLLYNILYFLQPLGGIGG